MYLSSSILKVLAYFDVFSYPLTTAEIRFFLDRAAGFPEIEEALAGLVSERSIYQIDEFYALRDSQEIVTRRLKGNRRADSMLQVAEKGSRFLYQFPFVRGIGISGSLSKHFADEHADIDYFIITRSNRLWIARTLMHLFKKLTFLTGQQHCYCMNYYVDEAALEIQEKNLFTATELITLVAACGNGSLTRFFEANHWVEDWLPQYPTRPMTAPGHAKSGPVKRLLEWVFDNRAGDLLDNWLRRLTTRRWQQKESDGKLTDHGLPMSLKNDKHFSRPNPEMLQKKILSSYQDKLAQLSIPSSGS